MQRLFLVKSVDFLYIVLEKEAMYFRAITRGEFPLRSSKRVLCFLPVMAAGVESRRIRLDGVSHTGPEMRHCRSPKQ